MGMGALDLLKRTGAALIALVYGAILVAMLTGGFRPLDDALRDFRFSASTRPVTGSVVFVDIDARSLSSVGVWPWPRQVHAQLLDQLMQLGASEVLFDIDFSLPSDPKGDSAFAEALKNAGGYAYLAAFQQQRSSSGALSFNLPQPLLRQYADPLAVNVSLDRGGVVRTYPFAMMIGSDPVPSAAAALSGVKGTAGTGFSIDYSIDPNQIDRIPASDLLAGKVDPARIAGKQIIIAASAVELRDFFVVPRFGLLPGGLVQAMAAETLKQGRALQPVWPYGGVIVVGLIALAALLLRRRTPLPVAVASALALSVAAELLALLLQINFALLIDTAAIHAAGIGFALTVIIAELATRGRQRLAALRERDAVRLVLDRVITDNFDGVVVIAANGKIVTASQFAETMLGRPLTGQPAVEALPEAFHDLLAVDRSEPGELRFDNDGRRLIIEYVVTRSELDAGGVSNIVTCLTFRDITERSVAAEQLRFIGEHDVLTGTLRRTKLIERIEASLADGEQVSVVMVDLKRFRSINDTLGHDQGDLLLKQVASRLNSMGPLAVARLGGDSFALMLPGMDPIKLLGFCETVAQWLAFPYELADAHQAVVAASAGATTSTLSGRDPLVLLAHADMALSVAKQIAGNGVALFTPEMDVRLKERQAMDGALRRALVENQFTLAYQPQVDLKSREIVGVEALCRWEHPTMGPISPARFIPAAEETGLIIELGRWVLDTACREAAHWPRPITIGVNVSPLQVELTDIVADVTAALEASGLPASRLEIEITEGVFVKNFEAVSEKLRALQKLGVGVALDDFGTGYSSLSYLGRLPIDRIKIDQSFVNRLPADLEAGAIVRAVAALSDTLGKLVIAEGIETADQAWMLEMAGCQQGQGYYFGKPMPVRELVAKLHGKLRLVASAG